MTRLAAHADLREARGKAIVGRVIVLAHAGRMALRAHEVPVLVQLGPVQNVVVLDLLVRIEMKPALAAFVLRPAVPGDRQRLQPAVRELDEILLQRIDAECVLHLERGELAVGTVGLDQELPVLAEEARTHAVIIEARIGEIAEHRFLGGVLHRVLVLGAAPQVRFGAVAAGAGLAADERGRGGGIAAKAVEERMVRPAGPEAEIRRRSRSSAPTAAATRTFGVSKRAVALLAARPRRHGPRSIGSVFRDLRSAACAVSAHVASLSDCDRAADVRHPVASTH